MQTPFLQVVAAVLRKDLLAELRSRELVSAMALFSLLSVLVFSFALQLNLSVRREAVSGVLWVTITFAVVLGFSRSSAAEREGGSFQAMMLAPVSRGAVYLGKVLGNFFFSTLVGIILLPVMTVLYNVPLVQWGTVGSVIFGALGLSAAGTFLATMTVQTRTRETLLPIVLLPVALPLLLAVVSATNSVITGGETSDWAGWLILAATLDVIYLGLCFLLFDAVVEE